jgi:hypothetical protein
VIHTANYGTPAGKAPATVLLRNMIDGRVELHGPEPLRPRLMVNGGSIWSSAVPASGVVTGAEGVHQMLMEFSRSARSRFLFHLLSGSSVSASDLPFASVRDEGNAVVAELLVRPFQTEALSFSLDQPKNGSVAGVSELLMGSFLSKYLTQVKSGLPRTFGKKNEYVAGMHQSLLAWIVLMEAHMRFRRDATTSFLRLCQETPGVWFKWAGTDMNELEGSVISNAYFFNSKNGKRLIFSLVNGGVFHLNGDRNHKFSLSECCQNLIAAIK